jgi:hypothetical protein
MFRRIVPALPVLLIMIGCAGPSKLAEKSERQLAGGEATRAWELATRALDRDPGNARARAAATAAGNAIARDWEQRIAALAPTDSLSAADQVLELAAFRAHAVRYAVITVNPEWAAEEQALRQSAARTYYQRAYADLSAQRPKRAWLQFADVQHFVPDYRDAARLSDRAYQRALTRVAVVPFAASTGGGTLGRDVAAGWRDDLALHLTEPDVHFTRILGSAAIEQQMSVAQLGHLSRDDAVSLGRKAGAERVVWGSIDGIEAHTDLHLFTDVIARRMVEKDADGHEVTRWVDVPVEIVSRVRTVKVDLDYEVIATRESATLAHQHTQRSTSARVVWTWSAPQGNLADYALVSDLVRNAHPDRARDLEARWRDACGENTTVQQVFEARRAMNSAGHYDRQALPRFMTGAAFVFLQELPPPEDLAYAALASCQSLRADLARLDGVDDVDLGIPVVNTSGR